MFTPKTAPFLLLSAFTSDSHTGNPAAIILLPPTVFLDGAKMQAIARDLAQPVHTFVSPPTDGTDGDYGIRWFTAARELPMCGHGTLAAAKAMWSLPGLFKEGKDTFRFRAANGSVVFAQRILDADGEGERIEITFPQGPTTSIPFESPMGVKLRAVIAKALGTAKGGHEVEVRYMGHGTGPYVNYLLVELGESGGFRLEGRAVDTDAIRDTGYLINVLTSAGDTESEEKFVSRMFAPMCGVPEDPVCGSAHCLLAPYWAEKCNPTIAKSSPMLARQVSERGGSLVVSWDSEAGLVTIEGAVVVWARGEINI